MKNTLVITDLAAAYTGNIFVEIAKKPVDQRKKGKKGWIYHPVRRVVIYVPGLKAFYKFNRVDLLKLVLRGQYREVQGPVDNQGYYSVGVLIPLRDIGYAKRAKFVA